MTSYHYYLDTIVITILSYLFVTQAQGTHVFMIAKGVGNEELGRGLC